MKYPTREEIDIASKEQLARWCRFLINPTTENDRTILHIIFKLFLAKGGWTPILSKKVGWDPNKKSGKNALIDNMAFFIMYGCMWRMCCACGICHMTTCYKLVLMH